MIDGGGKEERISKMKTRESKFPWQERLPPLQSETTEDDTI